MPPLSPTRRRLYKKYRLEGYSSYAAAIKAGYSKSSARNAGRDLNRKIDFSKEMEIAGITDRKLAELLNEGLNAKDLHGMPDHTARVKYLTLALNLTNKIKQPSSTNNDPGGVKIIVIKSDHPKVAEVQDVEGKVVEEDNGGQIKSVSRPILV